MTTDVSAKDFNPSNNETAAELKAAANAYAKVVNNLPPSRRRSIALTHIETASMFAVKSLFYGDDNEPTEVA